MGENRVLAYHGLKQLNSNPSVGLKAIVDICGLQSKEITMNDIVFKIGPRINASGRIQNGKEAVELLIEKDFALALEKANQINAYNETRKDLDKSMTEEATKLVVDKESLNQRRSIVIAPIKSTGSWKKKWSFTFSFMLLPKSIVSGPGGFW